MASDVGQRIDHMAMLAEDAAKILTSKGNKVSCIVCDVNSDAAFVAEKLLLPLANLLVTGGALVLTLKLTKRAQQGHASRDAAAAQVELASMFENFEILHFLSNTSSERTLVAYRRDDQVPRKPLDAKIQAISDLSKKRKLNFDQNAKWDSELKSLVSWVKTPTTESGGGGGGRLPIPHARDREERDRATWVKRQRARHAANKLPPGSVSALEALEFWTWESEESSFKRCIAEMQEWIASKKALPPSHATLAEEGVYVARFVAACRRAFYYKALKKSQQAALEAVVGWSYTYVGPPIVYRNEVPNNSTESLQRSLGPRFVCETCGSLFNVAQELRICRSTHETASACR
jgi:hypothetical protein